LTRVCIYFVGFLGIQGCQLNTGQLTSSTYDVASPSDSQNINQTEMTRPGIVRHEAPEGPVYDDPPDYETPHGAEQNENLASDLLGESEPPVGTGDCGDGVCNLNERCLSCPEDCSPEYPWPDSWVQKENQILSLVNAARSQGAECGGANQPSAQSLEFNEALKWAARCHSVDMADREFFDHINPDGETPFQRMSLAGYYWTAAAENIAGNQSTSQAAYNAWLNSPGHCNNFMNGMFEDTGVGYYGTSGHYWTQVFGRP
jgi:uncharacterized protein YkwD